MRIHEIGVSVFSPFSPMLGERASPDKVGLLFCLFDIMLYFQGKQLRSCWVGQLLNHTVPGQASQRQFTSIKCPFFRQKLTTSSP